MQNNLKDKIFSKISYTKQDYEGILDDFKKMFTGKDAIVTGWDNMSETDIIFILMSIFAAHKDILNYMLDYRTLEGFMSTAKERPSIVRIANSFGYKIPSYKAGMAEFKLQAINTGKNNAYISFGTQFIDDNNIPWVYFDESDDFTSGNTLKLYQGILHSLSINIENAKDTNKTHILNFPNIAIGSSYRGKPLSKLIHITNNDTDNVVEFKEVESLYRYDGTDKKVYELNVDPQGITYIKFHRDLDLDQYTSGDSFMFYYVTTSGDAVTRAYTISESLLPATDSDDPEINPFSLIPTGTFFIGANPLSAERIKEDFKYYYANSDLLITHEDIKNFILNRQEVVQGINRCLVIDKQFDTAGRANRGKDNIDLGEVKVYVIKKDNTLLKEDETIDEKQALQEELNKYTLAGINVIVNNEGEELSDELSARQVAIKLGFNANQEFKKFLVNYINNLPIGEPITSGQINQAINNSEFRDYFNKNNGSVAIVINNKVYTELDLDYYEYTTIDEGDISE